MPDSVRSAVTLMLLYVIETVSPPPNVSAGTSQRHYPELGAARIGPAAADAVYRMFMPSGELLFGNDRFGPVTIKRNTTCELLADVWQRYQS